MKKDKHPKTYVTKVFVGDKESYIVSTVAQTIMVVSPEAVWFGKKTIVGETPESLRLFEEV